MSQKVRLKQHADTKTTNLRSLHGTWVPTTTSLLLQFDQVLTRMLFHHHVQNLYELKFPLTQQRAMWMYACWTVASWRMLYCTKCITWMLPEESRADTSSSYTISKWWSSFYSYGTQCRLGRGLQCIWSVVIIVCLDCSHWYLLWAGCTCWRWWDGFAVTTYAQLVVWNDFILSVVGHYVAGSQMLGIFQVWTSPPGILSFSLPYLLQCNPIWERIPITFQLWWVCLLRRLREQFIDELYLPMANVI
jgi:hypothetical protein